MHSVVTCYSMSDLAKVIFENASETTSINFSPSDIGVDSPSKLFFFLVNIINEGLLILCKSDIVTMSEIDILKKKIKSIGIEMVLDVLPRHEKANPNAIVMALGLENNRLNLSDYKLFVLYPNETYKIHFDFPRIKMSTKIPNILY